MFCDKKKFELYKIRFFFETFRFEFFFKMNYKCLMQVSMKNNSFREN